MWLLVKIAGVSFEGSAPREPTSLHVVVHVEPDSSDVQAARTQPVDLGQVTVVDEELLLQLSRSALKEAKKLAFDVHTAHGVIGSVTLPWTAVVAKGGDGLEVRGRLMQSEGYKMEGELLARVLYVDSDRELARLAELRAAAKEASSSLSNAESAAHIELYSGPQQLAEMRTRLQKRLSSAASARAEAEVAEFRVELEERTHAARKGREQALAA